MSSTDQDWDYFCSFYVEGHGPIYGALFSDSDTTKEIFKVAKRTTFKWLGFDNMDSLARENVRDIMLMLTDRTPWGVVDPDGCTVKELVEYQDILKDIASNSDNSNWKNSTLKAIGSQPDGDF